MKLTAQTKVLDLIEAHPFVEDYLVSLSQKFRALKNPVMRATVAKFATLQDAAGMAELPLESLLCKLQDEIANFDPEKAQANKRERQAILKQIIGDLHNGATVEDAKRRFTELVKTIDAAEIANLEQSLIADGMPESEITRLCDVHVKVFEDSLSGGGKAEAPVGHPVNTFMRENRVAEEICERLGTALQEPKTGADYQSLVSELREIDKHYLRKEMQLFPLLEKHNISGPSRVMWAFHDETRRQLKKLHELAAAGYGSDLVFAGRPLIRAIKDMIYKEEYILFPMCLETLSAEEWKTVRHGEEEIGFAWIGAVTGPAGTSAIAQTANGFGVMAGLQVDTGVLSLDQIRLIFTHLPVDLSFVNEKDEVLFYSGQKERIFPRSPGVIGRKVQNCHPAASVHIVNEILDEFRKGTKEVAEFWIQYRGRFIHIQYFAVRDPGKNYRGCLEVTQDVTAIRKLEGERRILDWGK
ncbi:MAG: DUF438 domain-containing protein [Deltaproteobacteria bacterium]|nr:DUF438 domain-containing protein [Deltaproteobacteria bacterium]